MKFTDPINDLDDVPLKETDPKTGEERVVTFRDVIRTALNTPLRIDERENGTLAGNQSFDRFLILAKVQECIKSETDMPGDLGTFEIEDIKKRAALCGMGAIVIGRLYTALDPVGTKQRSEKSTRKKPN